MKKILLCVLCLAMLFSCLTLTSCKKEVEDIDGLTFEEAYDKAIKSLDEIDRYRVDVGAKVKMLGVSVMKFDPFCVYLYDGENGAYYLDEKAKAKAKRMDVEDMFEDSSDEIVWYEGMCYAINGTEKICYADELDDTDRSDYERAIDTVIEEKLGDVTYYKKGNGYFVQIVIDDPDEMMLIDDEVLEAKSETYTIYFDEDGYITKIVLYRDTGLLGLEFVSTYSYDDLPPIEKPSDADQYENID